MKYAVNFGRLAARRPSAGSPSKTLRIAVLGDFSGRANAQTVEAGPALAERKPQPVDVDNFESVLRRMAPRLRLPIAPDGSTVEINFESLDDFHPDQLYNQVELFSELAGVRRRLKNSATFSAAANEVRSWASFSAADTPTPARFKSGGTTIPRGKLDDFERLLGRRPTAIRDTPAQDLIKQIVGPHIVAATDPQQETMLAAVDEALAATMRRVLHHPDFQALESIWRSVELLTREIETGSHLQMVLYDVTAEELAADLSAHDALEDSGLYRLLVDGPSLDAQSGPLSVFVANYVFEQTPPHAELLGRVGKIAAAAEAPFIAAISAECLKQQAPEDVHPLIVESWNTLRSLPHASYLCLTVPRFMLRWPYGQKTEPIESFRFEEFTPQAGLKGMLWANGSMLAGLLLGKTFSEQGIRGMRLGSIMSLGDVPFYYFTDADGDQVALPNTERMVTESTAVYAISQGLMPVLCVRGRAEVRLGSFQSLAGTELAGPWSPLAIEPDAKVAPAPAGEQHVQAEDEVPTVEAFEAQAASEAEDELDALLAGLMSDGDASSSTSAAEAPSSDEASSDSEVAASSTVDELDSLLAGLTSNEAEQSSDDSQMDPDLADLLASF